MKIKNIYKILVLAVLFVTLQSRSNGPGSVANLQVTGAPGSGGNLGTCANMGCHASNSFSPSISIQLLDGTEPKTAYQPGKSYTVKVALNATSGTPAGYGFQAVGLDNSNNQSGAWGDLGTGKQIVELGGRNYIEHSTPGSSNTFEMEWVAPAAGTGSVTFYSAGIASNLNGSTAGDGTANTSLTVGEDPSNSVADHTKEIAQLRAAPNPVQETLNLEISSRSNGIHHINIMDVMGKKVSTTTIDVQPGLQVSNINVATLPPGLYIVQLCGDGHLAATQILKR